MLQKSLFSRNKIITEENDESNSLDADSETDFAISEKINLQNQSPGLYFLKIESEKNSQVFRIIKR